MKNNIQYNKIKSRLIRDTKYVKYIVVYRLTFKLF